MERVFRQTSLLAIGFTFLVPAIGYLCFGIWPALLFLSGYLTGFLLWYFLPTQYGFRRVRTVYISAFLLFILHRVEEKVYGFFAALAAITGEPVPEIVSWPVIALVLLSVGGWVGGAYLFAKGKAFGAYLMWTFFASLGVTELAHFVLPLFTDKPYGYFPGMASVLLLAPVAWYGMYRLAQNGNKI